MKFNTTKVSIEQECRKLKIKGMNYGRILTTDRPLQIIILS